MTKNEYKRRVFNAVLSESFSLLYAHVTNLGSNINETTSEAEVARLTNLVKVAKDTFISEMNLNESTISKTKARLEESGSRFALKLMVMAEAVAEAKSECGPVENIEGDTPIELGDIEEKVISSIFEDELDEDNVEEIRNRVAQAIHKEKIRSAELKKATSLEQEASPDGTLSESTVRKLSAPPTTILESIYKAAVGKVSRENLESNTPDMNLFNNQVIVEAIKDTAENTYAIYETIGGFGFKRYTEDDAKRLIKTYYDMGHKN